MKNFVRGNAFSRERDSENVATRQIIITPGERSAERKFAWGRTPEKMVAKRPICADFLAGTRKLLAALRPLFLLINPRHFALRARTWGYDKLPLRDIELRSREFAFPRFSVPAMIFAIFCVPAICVPAMAGAGDDLISFRSGKTGAIGLMTEDGREIVPALLDAVGKFSCGFCPVRIGERWGYVSAEGQPISEMNLRTARPFQTTRAGTPFASVRSDRGWNFIDERGFPIFPTWRGAEITDAKTLGMAEFYADSRAQVRKSEISSESFLDYAQRAVNAQLAFWYPKKDYETTQDWRSRTTDEKLKLKLEHFRGIAAARFAAERGAKNLVPADFELKKYDADNSAFLLIHKAFGAVLVSVPRVEAARFRTNWERAKITAPDYAIGKNDRLILKNLDFVMPDGKVYHADPDAIFEAAVDFGSLSITLPGGAQEIEIPPRSVVSDVDKNVPENPLLRERPRFVCILANETYERAPNVWFAGEDAYAFEKYCHKTLGVPRERIVRSKNNSRDHMKSAVRDIAAKARAFPDAEVIFFYVGNSVEDRYGNEYLLPTDCRLVDGVSGGYKLKELYDDLGEIKAKTVTVFLDSTICHRSTDAAAANVDGNRKKLVETADAFPSGKSIVFRSALADEIPQRFPEKSHGVFTYFLLKKIQETRGNVSMVELADYLEEKIKQTSRERFDVDQSAHATPSDDFGDAWAELKLR